VLTEKRIIVKKTDGWRGNGVARR